MKIIDIAFKDLIRSTRSLFLIGMALAAPLLLTALIYFAFGSIPSGEMSMASIKVGAVNADVLPADAPLEVAIGGAKLGPREIAKEISRVQRLQQMLLQPTDVVTKRSPPGVILWPYQDLAPGDPCFVAANVMAVRGIYRTDDGVPDFDPERAVTEAELQSAKAIANVKLSMRPRSRAELVMTLHGALQLAEGATK